jgi:ABC-type sugar transport system ATPase subunit
MASLTLKNVWKKYGKVIALKGVNCEVKDGEFQLLKKVKSYLQI